MVMINRKKHTERHVKHYWMIAHNPSSALQFHYSIAKTYKGVFVCFVLTTTTFFYSRPRTESFLIKQHLILAVGLTQVVLLLSIAAYKKEVRRL